MSLLILTPQIILSKKQIKQTIQLYQPDSIVFLEHPYLFGLRPKTSGGSMKFHPYKFMLLRAAGELFRKSLPKHDFIPLEDFESFKIPKTVSKIYLFDHDDHDLEKYFQKLFHSIEWIPSPLFILTKQQILDYKPNGKKLQQTAFYTQNRINFNILIDKNQKPIGGKWTYDTENRHPLPPNYPLPKVKGTHAKTSQAAIQKAIAWIQTPTIQKLVSPYFNGKLDDFWCPLTHKEAQKCLQEFFTQRFAKFGEFQDGITKRTDFPFLFHSAISSSINIGLLHPLDVIQQAQDLYYQNKIDLAACEGFIRQILGWREFERLIYHQIGEEIRQSNYFNHQQRLNQHWYEGTTTIAPLDDAIYMAFHDGYIHHILRLMVVCNIMNLSQIHPDDVYRWFMEFSVDSWDWVMVGNVYSMGLYADGGKTTSKVYISSSNYEQIRLGDYPKKAEWKDTWDALYWNMIGTNPVAMKAMGRFGPIQKKFWDHKTPEEQKEFKKVANDFIQKFTNSP